jgi:hypothetical protein
MADVTSNTPGDIDSVSTALSKLRLKRKHRDEPDNIPKRKVRKRQPLKDIMRDIEEINALLDWCEQVVCDNKDCGDDDILMKP